jgi:nucleotide-binding universal stress UspA family protein
LPVLISKILVGFDGSKSADKALEFALDLAEKYAAPLVVLNVFEPPVYGSPEDPLAGSLGMTGLVKDLRKSHENILARGAGTAAKLKPNVEVSTLLREGNTPTEIVAAAQQGNFDVVVLGHGGEGRFGEIFWVG